MPPVGGASLGAQQVRGTRWPLCLDAITSTCEHPERASRATEQSRRGSLVRLRQRNTVVLFGDKRASRARILANRRSVVQERAGGGPTRAGLEQPKEAGHLQGRRVSQHHSGPFASEESRTWGDTHTLIPCHSYLALNVTARTPLACSCVLLVISNSIVHSATPRARLSQRMSTTAAHSSA